MRIRLLFRKRNYFSWQVVRVLKPAFDTLVPFFQCWRFYQLFFWFLFLLVSLWCDFYINTVNKIKLLLWWLFKHWKSFTMIVNHFPKLFYWLVNTVNKSSLLQAIYIKLYVVFLAYFVFYVLIYAISWQGFWIFLRILENTSTKDRLKYSSSNYFTNRSECEPSQPLCFISKSSHGLATEYCFLLLCHH